MAHSTSSRVLWSASPRPSSPPYSSPSTWPHFCSRAAAATRAPGAEKTARELLRPRDEAVADWRHAGADRGGGETRRSWCGQRWRPRIVLRRRHGRREEGGRYGWGGEERRGRVRPWSSHWHQDPLVWLGQAVSECVRWQTRVGQDEDNWHVGPTILMVGLIFRPFFLSEINDCSHVGIYTFWKNKKRICFKTFDIKVSMSMTLNSNAFHDEFSTSILNTNNLVNSNTRIYMYNDVYFIVFRKKMPLVL